MRVNPSVRARSNRRYRPLVTIVTRAWNLTAAAVVAGQADQLHAGRHPAHRARRSCAGYAAGCSPNRERGVGKCRGSSGHEADAKPAVLPIWRTSVGLGSHVSRPRAPRRSGQRTRPPTRVSRRSSMGAPFGGATCRIPATACRAIATECPLSCSTQSSSSTTSTSGRVRTVDRVRTRPPAAAMACASLAREFLVQFDKVSPDGGGSAPHAATARVARAVRDGDLLATDRDRHGCPERASRDLGGASCAYKPR